MATPTPSEHAAGVRGRLDLVATPIGNLGDLSPRAVDAIRGAALVCCEDTRRTGRLLQHAGVTGARLAVCNEHTETACATTAIEVLGEGGNVAVVTDAGTPGISDPGERLVRAVLAAGYGVSPVPGPAAFVAGLVASGLPTARFVFEGFLPRRGPARRGRLADIAAERRTVVLYEAPHRIDGTIGDLAAACGSDRPAALARELTKLHETIQRGTLGSLDTSTPRGEYVVVIGPAPAVQPDSDPAAIDAAIDAALDRGRSTKEAAAEVAEEVGLPKRDVYARTLERRAGRRGAAGDTPNASARTDADARECPDGPE